MMDVTADRHGREGCGCLLCAGYRAKSFTYRLSCHRGTPRYWNHHQCVNEEAKAKVIKVKKKLKN